MSASAAPETPSVILITSIAGGFGDAVFGLNLAVGLVKRPAFPLRVSLVLRNALGGDDLLANVLRLKDEVECQKHVDVDVFAMDREHALSAVWPAECSLPSRPLAIIQAPLSVFSTLHEALSVFGILEEPQKGLITVREYGHGQFSSLSMPSPSARDVSSGIGSGEIGMFFLQDTVSNAATNCLNHLYVGHFRSAGSLSRLCRSVLAVEAMWFLDNTCDDGDTPIPCANLMWNWNCGGDEACSGTFRKLGCVVDAAPGETDTSVLSNGAYTGSSHFLVKYPVPDSDGVVVEFRVCLSDLGLLKPSISAFRTLLSSSSAVVVCGDQSLNEVR
jgi:hypothetical protein